MRKIPLFLTLASFALVVQSHATYAETCSAQCVSELQERVASLEKRLAALEAWVHNRYVDNGDGTVTDNRTGLVWLKNANCFGKQDWQTAMQSAAKLADGQYGLNEGSRRRVWRLPTLEELEAMIGTKYYMPMLSNAAGTGHWTEGDAFSNVQSDSYWTSSTEEGLFGSSFLSASWSLNLDNSSRAFGSKEIPEYVWPVRRRVDGNEPVWRATDSK